MRLLKTWLRSTMKDDQLSSLALMHFNYGLDIRYEQLIKKWSQLKDRLMTLDIEQRLNDFEQCWNFLLIFSIFLKCLVTCGYVLASMMNFNITPIFLLNSGTVRTLFQPPKPKNFPGALPLDPIGGCTPKPRLYTFQTLWAPLRRSWFENCKACATSQSSLCSISISNPSSSGWNYLS